MALMDLDVRIVLNRIHCIMHGENKHDEPYILTVFFKVDGDTVIFNSNTLKLEGTATVVGTASGQGDLSKKEVRAGEDAAIPAAVGEYKTTLKPIPVQPLLPFLPPQVQPTIGYLMMLWEEDKTTAYLVGTAYGALRDSLKDELDKLVPQLGAQKQSPTSTDIQVISSRIEAAVKNKVAGSNLFDIFASIVDPDDRIGQSVMLFPYSVLFNNSYYSFSDEWITDEDGQYQMFGHVESLPIYEFVPVEPNVLHLAPVTGAGLDAWEGAWYGTPDDGKTSGIYVGIGRSRSSGLDIVTVENTGFPPIATQTVGAQPTSQPGTRYERDKWTFLMHVAPVAIRPQVSSPRVAPLVGPNKPKGSAMSEGVIVGDVTDSIWLGRNVRLSLYAEEDQNNIRQRYRVRYTRSSLEDVMLAQKPVG
jgi:hypothetical protein